MVDLLLEHKADVRAQGASGAGPRKQRGAKGFEAALLCMLQRGTAAARS